MLPSRTRVVRSRLLGNGEGGHEHYAQEPADHDAHDSRTRAVAEGYASAFRNEDSARNTVLDQLLGRASSRIIAERGLARVTEVTLGAPLPMLASLVVFKSATSERDPAGDAENPHLSPGRKA